MSEVLEAKFFFHRQTVSELIEEIW